ncbi:hypothetical protein HAL_33550 [Haladaptatus sp. T7]|nr:hypothetical protein HAL_33550 [Haladaptatus sp. T7]
MGHSICDPQEDLNSRIENPHTIEIQSVDTDKEQTNSTEKSESGKGHYLFAMFEIEIKVHGSSKEYK